MKFKGLNFFWKHWKDYIFENVEIMEKLDFFEKLEFIFCCTENMKAVLEQNMKAPRRSLTVLNIGTELIEI